MTSSSPAALMKSAQIAEPIPRMTLTATETPFQVPEKTSAAAPEAKGV
eukprot:CAMPEP_0175960892 /NCGR_PEP_ID=MMETSP0108-20121206/35625_1 /TAXON_ID=195067 ORGANISM="Goniomonas pacifica, Strain CCMP1869" /NCGR_SAMPLE_ID=MMETSP0108 /ASSEMBLY_ACC=CAM_ASM_000204 /LENGTH=47 /DNA_ID= /DNA_START= /DNA_END= /DNA_ORIENTATION=